MKYLSDECNLGYKVIEINDILEKYSKIQFDNVNLKQILKHLERNGFVNVKYSDDDVFCVCVLPYGRQFLEDKENQNKQKNEIKHFVSKILFAVFFSALIASFLGTLIYNLIF